jgi:DNA-binding XRE family transcriptional regulator
MKPVALRERLGLARAEWARALGVQLITVKRWEDDDRDPGGLAAEVMRGITAALEDGADPARVGRLVSMGIGSLLCYGIISKAVR